MAHFGGKRRSGGAPHVPNGIGRVGAVNAEKRGDSLAMPQFRDVSDILYCRYFLEPLGELKSNQIDEQISFPR